jgi:hypothetical protein
MTCVTDIVLLANLAEARSDGQDSVEPKAVVGINGWPGRGGWAPLVSISDRLDTETAFQTCAKGGARDRLDIPGFLKAVADQP